MNHFTVRNVWLCVGLDRYWYRVSVDTGQYHLVSVSTETHFSIATDTVSHIMSASALRWANKLLIFLLRNPCIQKLVAASRSWFSQCWAWHWYDLIRVTAAAGLSFRVVYVTCFHELVTVTRRWAWPQPWCDRCMIEQCWAPSLLLVWENTWTLITEICLSQRPSTAWLPVSALSAAVAWQTFQITAVFQTCLAESHASGATPNSRCTAQATFIWYSVWPKVCHHVTTSNPASCVYVVMATAKQWVYVNFWPTAFYGHNVYSL